ncbi:placental protein [Anaeramoeba flamelloides]|uniref:Placental protein n=1 Tax=Anaeramoeba flamelloides TaxID=1746091 RepID=A0AAV7YD82_9EUKA|nr:placental protein [Anaeramoeba flamelloides]
MQTQPSLSSRITTSQPIRALALILVGLPIITMSNENMQNYLSFSLSKFLSPNYYIWTIFTAPFYEPSIIGAIFSVLALLFLSKTFEQSWSPRELIRFIIIVSIGTSFSTFLFIWILSFFFRSSSLGILTFSGFSCVIGGFLVGFKQILPEKEVSLICGKLRAKNLPAVYLLISLLFGLLDNMSGFVYSFFGILIAWIYLRYFQKHEIDGTKGDHSAEFSLKSFLPEGFHSSIDSVSNKIPFVDKNNNQGGKKLGRATLEELQNLNRNNQLFDENQNDECLFEDFDLERNTNNPESKKD